MKTELRKIAFSGQAPEEGIALLLEIAVEELDREGFLLSASYADMALATLRIGVLDRSYSLALPMTELG
jgi:hypothetical protein